MNDTGIRPEVIEEIRNLAQKYDIEKVILFGSRARGDFRRTSDCSHRRRFCKVCVRCG